MMAVTTSTSPRLSTVGFSLIRRNSSSIIERNNRLVLPLHNVDSRPSSTSPFPPRSCEISLCSSSSSSSSSSSVATSSSSSSSTYRQRSAAHVPSSLPLWTAASDGDYDIRQQPHLYCKTSSLSTTTTRNSNANTNKVKKSEATLFLVGGVIVFCAVIWIGCYHIVQSFLHAHDEAVRQTFVAAEVLPLTKDIQQKVEYLKKENAFLQDRLAGLEMEHQQPTAGDSFSSLQQQIVQLDQQSIHYQHSIRKLSKYALLERFGNGPHIVEMQLAAFDPNLNNIDNNTNKIILEIATSDKMPHAVYWFLEQVTRGHYDGNTSIHRDSSATTTSRRVLFQGRRGPAAHAQFEPSDFDPVVLLPEEYYSNWNTDQKYAVCYDAAATAGAPPGPLDFYFNMLDNADKEKAQAETAEPLCFARVIAGFDLVDAIHASPTNHALYQDSNVAIVSMRLLNPNESQSLSLQLLESTQ